MALLDARAGRVILTVLLIMAGLAFVWKTWHVLVAFLFAIFFAYLIDPVVRLLMRWLKLGRGQAIAAVYFLIFVGLAVLFLFIGPNIAREADKLANTLPDLYEKIASGQIAWQVGAAHGWSSATKLRIQHFLVEHSSTINLVARDFGLRLARLGSNAWWLIVIPVLAVFFLKDGEKFSQAAVDILSRQRQREFLQAVMNDIHMVLAHYIRAQMILAVLAMGVYVAGFSILRVPYAAILGVIAGFLEFLPMVGPLISAVLIGVVVVGAGYQHILILALFLLVWRGIQDYMNAPRIMGHQLQLHPLAVLFGIFAGVEIGGILGVYLSIPIMATLRIFWRRWQAYVRGQAATRDGVSELITVPEKADRQKSA